MNELMQKITEKLNIAIDKAPEVYEMLKHQYIIYDVCNVIIGVLATVFTILLILLVISLFQMSDSREEEWNFYMKVNIVLGVLMLLIIAVSIGTYIYRNINAPDVLFLKEVLLGG